MFDKLDSFQKGRLKHLIKECAIIVGIGLAYLVFALITGISIPCIFHLITDRYCPGCGITRMFMDIARLDFSAAASHNLLVFSLLPYGIFIFIYKSYLYVKKGFTDDKLWEKIIYVILCVLCVAFWILRNLEGFEFLRP